MITLTRPHGGPRLAACAVCGGSGRERFRVWARGDEPEWMSRRCGRCRGRGRVLATKERAA